VKFTHFFAYTLHIFCTIIIYRLIGVYLYVGSTELIPWRRLLEKLVKKSSGFHGNLWFITVSTRARHWSLSWARWIRSTPSHTTSL